MQSSKEGIRETIVTNKIGNNIFIIISLCVSYKIEGRIFIRHFFCYSTNLTILLSHIKNTLYHLHDVYGA